MTLRLSTSTLEAIERGGIPAPHYDRAALTPRILHLGVGGFHAHTWRSTSTSWRKPAAVGGFGASGSSTPIVGSRACSSRRITCTLIERDSNGSRPRIVGSIVDYRLVADDTAAFAQQVAHPEIAILSMTITEGGYSLDKPNPTIDAIVTGLDVRRAAPQVKDSVEREEPKLRGAAGRVPPRPRTELRPHGDDVVSAVRGETTSRSAISAFVRPSTKSASTSSGGQSAGPGSRALPPAAPRNPEPELAHPPGDAPGQRLRRRRSLMRRSARSAGDGRACPASV